MEDLTINKALVMRKALIGRRDQLKELVSSSSTRKKHYYGESNQVQETEAFNVKAADSMKVRIDMALFKLDSAIKQANAVTKISLDGEFSFENLMAPLEEPKV